MWRNANRAARRVKDETAPSAREGGDASADEVPTRDVWGVLPQTVRAAVRSVHGAAPARLRVAVGLEVASAAITGGQLFVIKSLASRLIRLARDDGHSVSAVIPAFAALVLVSFAGGLVTAMLERSQRLLGELVARHMLDRVVDVGLSADLFEFETPDFHDRLERATQAATFRPLDVVNGLLGMLLGLLTSAGIFVALATLQPLLIPMVFVAAIPVIVATLFNSRRSYQFEYGMTSSARERHFLYQLFIERDPGKELRAFNAGGYLRQRYDALSDERIARVTAFLRGRLYVATVGVVGGAVGSAAVVGALVWLLSTGRIGVATAATAAVATQALSSQLSVLTGAAGRLVESSMFLDDSEHFIAKHAKAMPRARRASRREAFEELVVDGLSFGYPGTLEEVLKDVSLEIKRGEIVALVGENGSGKTTLAKILSQLYPYDRGSVRYNGRELKDIGPDEFRGNMTVLFQDFVRYHLSVADNIVLGRSDVPLDEARVHASARRSGVASAIEALPAGYEARLGREFAGGLEISGGQWQRLALARAFYRGGDFLVMDEPTAALDPRGEYELFSQIRDLAADKSVLLISHRFANVKMADRIYVLRSGAIVESGSHEALLDQDGLYAELYRLQQSTHVRAP